jgi:ATPase components of various ABC-type transport systems, contain duplicated ATPase
VPRFRSEPAPAVNEAPVLQVERLRKVYRTSARFFGSAREVVAVDDVSFSIARGETLGLVGESGSGKSTIGQCLVRLFPIDGGRILVGGRDVTRVSGKDLKDYRAKVQIIFQDPFASLNPRHTVGRSILTGPLALGVDRATAEARMNRLLTRVGLDPSAASRYPHEFSGGQRQRIGIARALAVEPDLLIADECVSALDVSVQAQVLDLLREIRDEMHLAMLFITHDLRVASQICDRVIVLHRGKIVEEGEVSTVFSNPQAPYTRRLIDSVPGRSWHEPASVHEV